MFQESILIPLPAEGQLHLKRIYSNPKDPPLLLLHGLMSNGKVFYTQSGKGLAPYLAKNGFDVYIPDLKGVGESTPLVNRHSKHGQTEAILQELPLFIKQIKNIKGDVPQHWMGHSWGGVMLAACYARFPELQKGVQSLTFLASRRRVRGFSLKKLFVVKFLLYTFSAWVSKAYGYWAVKKLKFGQENNTRKMHQQAMRWFKTDDWTDDVDQFDYAQAFKKAPLTKVQSFSGSADDAAGHPDDIKLFLEEIGAKDVKNVLVGKKEGFSADYDHVTLLTHPKSVSDHFPLIVKGLKKTV